MVSATASNNVSFRTPYYARNQINFHTNAAFEAKPEALASWTEIKSRFLGSNWFESLVVEKDYEYFKIRFGDLTEDLNFLTYFRKELFLQRHELGFYIGPHTDIPTRVFTCIFSFADRSGFEEFGTQLLAYKDPLVRCWGNDHYTPDDFLVGKLAPHKPNNFLLFYKTRQSFHSVRGIGNQVPNQRYGMQFQFYEPGQGLFKDLSQPDVMATKHRSPPPKMPASWLANSATYLKRSTALASTLEPESEIEIEAGDIIAATRYELHADHIKLMGGALNGRALGECWFALAPCWSQQKLTPAEGN